METYKLLQILLDVKIIGKAQHLFVWVLICMHFGLVSDHTNAVIHDIDVKLNQAMLLWASNL